MHVYLPGTVWQLILAGHSGAYRVMANILQNGNVPVNEVILFDALYAETDKFMIWLTATAIIGLSTFIQIMAVLMMKQKK